MPKILTEDQIAFYHDKGWLKVENVIPPRSIELGRKVCADWVDRTVQAWVDQGLLDDGLAHLDLEHRLTDAWNEAGKPMYQRSPRRQIVSPELFEFMSEPHVIDIAEDLLGSPEVFMHGVFNLRPKLPDQRWTRTPWHQDSQYYPSIAQVHTLSIWMPLMRVTAENSCLQVAEGYHRGDMYAITEDEETGFLGISKEERAALPGIPIEMEAGDALCFTQLTPHAALPNKSDAVRWSIDLRYQSIADAFIDEYNVEIGGRDKGFIARSEADPASVATWESWERQWEGDPYSAY
ncbi:MAG: phytanoyl-CoA dioxygenase family protein [Chloroflexota bacterium]|nr:phytanoyl-CoA dioxygenase family protein [Chloroflexota bacterium]MDE2946466.1 phytanoyl-CoA dioxygenase family protein [Chloroflexota bacterium]